MEIKSGKSIALGVLAGLVLLGGLSGAFYSGFKYGLAQPKVVVLEGLKNVDSPDAVDFNLFWQAWKLIKEEALKGGEVKNTDLVHGAIRGLINSLDDPHSVFLTPDDAKKFEEDISGSFSGVGMEIGKKSGNLVVIAPLKNTPAERSGLLPNDRILKIDERFTNEMDVDQAVKHIRGPAGTEVALLIFREAWEEAREFKIKRQVIDVPTVEFEMKENDLAYIKLNTFNEKAPQHFFDALVKASEGKARGIILDLRNNPGGFLEVAVNIAGYFLDRGKLVVAEQFRSGEREEFKTQGTGDLKNIPVVVLVNGGSASASEILAGALHDHRGIKLVGEKTFGKGTVQVLKDLTDGSNLKITVANWVLPSGAIIEKNGLEPDFKVEVSEADTAAKKDPQLQKAIEVLKSELESASNK